VVGGVGRDCYGVWSEGGAGIAVTEPYGFTGHAEDGSGEVWGRARHYAPTVGSWMSEDPIKFEGRYGYVAGSVKYASDSEGLGTEYAHLAEDADCRSMKAVGGQLRTESHHIGTNKSKRWSPTFEWMFAQVGMNLDDAANIVKVFGHFGPHPEAYHEAVVDRLLGVLEETRNQAISDRQVKFRAELKNIAADTAKPCTELNRYLTER
jgi:RHS repeat-associated protein